MGASQGFVLAISIIELTLLAVFAVAIGALLGYLAQSGLAWLLRDLIRTELARGVARAAAHRARHGVGHAHRLRFAAAAAMKSTPPARVLRKSVSAPPPALRVELLAGARGLVRDSVELGARHGSWCSPSSPGVLGVGNGADVGGIRSSASHRPPARRRGNRHWRYGLANVSARRRGQCRANRRLGLGLMVLLVLAVVRRRSARRFGGIACPRMWPNNFLINIRPEERQSLQEFLQSTDGAAAMFPMVRARITAINSRPSESNQCATERAAGSWNGSRTSLVRR